MYFSTELLRAKTNQFIPYYYDNVLFFEIVDKKLVSTVFKIFTL